MQLTATSGDTKSTWLYHRAAHAIVRRNGAIAAMAVCSGAGVALAFAHAHESLFPVAVAAVAACLAMAATAQQRWFGLLLGFAFGVGCFGVGLHWLFDLVDRGQSPVVASTLPALLIVALSLPTAIIGFCIAGSRRAQAFGLVLLAPALWTAFDWLRHQGDIAFPWFAVGYSQVPFSPLAGFAPLGGVLLVGFTTVMLAGLLVLSATSEHLRFRSVSAAAALLAIGAVLLEVRWTDPAREPLHVAVLQGNSGVARFDPATFPKTLSRYESMIRSSAADVMLLPESALPLPVNMLGSYLNALSAHARNSGADIVVGAFEIDAERRQRYSSALNFGPSGLQTYRKRQLVPFGDFIPWAAMASSYDEIQRVPFADTTRGAALQPLPVLGGGRVAVVICYDDAFGERMRVDAAASGWIADLSNDSWAHSRAMQRQHARIAQARALEFGRPLMRAADTGQSGFVDERGRWVDSLPLDEVGVLEAMVVPRQGATPYARWGDRVALSVCAIALLTALIRLLKNRWETRA